MRAAASTLWGHLAAAGALGLLLLVGPDPVSAAERTVLGELYSSEW